MGKRIADLKSIHRLLLYAVKEPAAFCFPSRKKQPIDVPKSYDIQTYASPSKRPRHRVLSNQIFSFNPLSI